MSPEQEQRTVTALEGINGKLWWVCFWLFVIFWQMPAVSCGGVK